MVECYNLSIELFFFIKDVRVNYVAFDKDTYLIKSWDMKINKYRVVDQLFDILYDTIISVEIIL
jgi:hypothetical protein